MFDIPLYFGQSPPGLLQFSRESEPKPLFATGILGGMNQGHPVSIFWVDFFCRVFLSCCVVLKEKHGREGETTLPPVI